MPLTAESLFERFFLPLYPPDVAADLAKARATDANPANNPALSGHLADAARVFVGMSQAVFGRDLGLDYSDASVHRLGAAMTRAWRDEIAKRGAAGTAESELFNVVVHGSAYVGECIVRSHGASWGVRRPLWESIVRFSSPVGQAELPVAHWWLKSLADDAFADDGSVKKGVAERYRAHVEAMLEPQGLAPIAPADRALPRIAKSVRYDVFHKYLKAHLPELRDVGKDFPSPERFDQYDFSWLDFLLVGGGKMLVVFGLGKSGLHVFWLGKEGFVKSALFASEAKPEPGIEASGDLLRVHVAVRGARATHEVMWWGP